MREIGEQWIENGRMLKAMPNQMDKYSKHMGGSICHGCSFVDSMDDDCTLPDPPCKRCIDKPIIHDLGPVNDMGMLRIPFEVPEGYPLYPTIKSYSTSIEAKDSLFQVVYSNVRLHMAYGFFNSEQEAIDAWNRRN